MNQKDSDINITKRRDLLAGLRRFGYGHNKELLSIAIALMSLAALVWLSYEYWRLLWQPDTLFGRSVHPGAIDFKGFYRMVHNWVTPRPELARARIWGVYPPASQVILWPFLGWLSLSRALLLWTSLITAAYGWLVWIIVRESRAGSVRERIFIALIPLSMYPGGATVGNGQLPLLLLPVLTAGLIMLDRAEPRWKTDLAASFLILLSLVKPTLTAPFFWIALFVPGRKRPAFLIITGYLLLTALALSLAGPTSKHPPVGSADKASQMNLQDKSDQAASRPPRSDSKLNPRVVWNQIVRATAEGVNWLERGARWSGKAGQANLHVLLESLGLREWILPSSLLVMALLGTWTFIYRRADLWILMGVAALTARFWAYHRWYDDLLILLPMAALFRIVKSGRTRHDTDVLAALLLGLTMLVMIAPGGLYLLPYPWDNLYLGVQVAIWLAVLIFLAACAELERKGRLTIVQPGQDRPA